MPNINVQGHGVIEVPANWATMTPAEQQAFIKQKVEGGSQSPLISTGPVTPTAGDPGEGQETLIASKPTEPEGTLTEGVFEYRGNTFDLTTEEGRTALLKFMAESTGDNQLLKDLESYIREHHPEENISKIIADEIINTILAGFLSGRLGTGGAAPLTTEDAPPSIDITVDESTAKYLLSAANSLAAGSAHFFVNAFNSFLAAFTDFLPRLPGSLTDTEKKELKKGYLVPQDSFWGRLNPELKKWVGYEENEDGTARIGGQTTAGAAGEIAGDVVALIVGPGKAKGVAKAAVKTALGKSPRTVRAQLTDALRTAAQTVRQHSRLGTKGVPGGGQMIAKDLLKDIGKGTLSTGGAGARRLAEATGTFAPLASEWVVAENLAKSMFDKYGAELSEENRKAWATWFAFNYVWADMTVQLLDAVMGVLYSIRGQRKSDVRTIGGLVLKVIFAEILTGSSIIAGIGITKIQKGEISPAEFITAVLNANLDVIGIGEPVTLNEVLQVIGGETPGVAGKDFDVIEFEGKSYTIRPPHTIIDADGKKVPRGSAMGNKIWAHWKEQYGEQAAGDQVIESNKGGLIARARDKGRMMNQMGLVAPRR